ncbi:hypothetical protein OQJ19_16245 [Fluoribacter gormanii]|uniref:Transmembrane protein n=1 Tax=Fluoribacter gormanii TaxID=464 RepID=A0A377GIM6_9GAMM|nr:hypothetical protein [Fluoribacter gormanii]KTD00312.1 transmembrane protein [Fluoribacter gormanii]MCW8443756.1 hypothetical protein [Fluoribacter gormanii]MCW8472184.1 hypothetical protein [Fluoribacter gormanii]SIQ90775.1 hypothetical protein SAMN05421777_10486 [Fluoribacter gormanii]STO24689.1 Uncharacterised protein [Fluoribacter gormanii]
MEQDRFSSNSKLYILGMICLVLCLGLFFFSLYILPFLAWGLNYNVPEVILTLLSSLQDDYNYTVGASKLIVWLIFFVPGLITGLISYFVSNYIDNNIYKSELNIKEEQESPSTKQIGKEIKESAGFGLKILGLMILIVIAIFLLQYLIQITV